MLGQGFNPRPNLRGLPLTLVLSPKGRGDTFFSPEGRGKVPSPLRGEG